MDTSKRNIERYIMETNAINQQENLKIILKRLTTMINNWDLFSEKTYKFKVQTCNNEPGFDLIIDDFQFNANTGICENAWPEPLPNCGVYVQYIDQMIDDWKKSIGNSCSSAGYFISGRDEYKDSNQLYRNSLRLHACLYFRNYIIDVLNSNG